MKNRTCLTLWKYLLKHLTNGLDKIKNNKMSYKLIVKVDENDADYIYRIKDIDEDGINNLKNFLSKLPRVPHSKHRYCSYVDKNFIDWKSMEEYLSEEEMDRFYSDFLPYPKYAASYIVSIKLLKVEEEIELL